MAAKQTLISPVDGSVVCERELATWEQASAALDRATAAQHAWKTVPVKERVAIVRRFVEALVSKKDEIGLELTMQMGRPVAYTPNEVLRAADRANYMMEVAEESLADVVIEDSPAFTRFIRKQPLGVVFVIAAWNYPYLISVNCVVPAILAGNAVILKQSNHTLLCAERFAEAFAAAGLPDGVFQVLHVSHAVSDQVIRDPRTSFVNFTGSVGGGHSVVKSASERFIATGLELGGKDPAYVRADCNFDYTVAELVDGSFFNSGQCCCAIERIYVHESLYDRFVDKFVELTKQYRLGDPRESQTTLGPMVRASAADAVRKQIQEAVAKGAKSLVDEALFPASKAGTPYLAPCVLVDVDHSMSVMMDETFGPVIGIMKVKDDDEAVRMMNDSPFGLTASIWTTDTEAAMRIGDRIETGTWFMNRCDYLDPALAWVGVKDSGRGVALSKLGFDALTRPKSFHLKKV